MSTTSPIFRNGHSIAAASAMTAPASASADAECAHQSESTSVMRERTYDKGMDVDYLLGLLRNQRETGTLRIDVSQGSINGIRFEQRQRIP